jgi:hypothetical protein
MKNPLFDDLRWDDLVLQTIVSPEFAEAWEMLKGSGIGSNEASAHVGRLIRDSKWHLGRLEVQHAGIMEAAAKDSWDGEPPADTDFDHKVAGELLTAAASYMVMGTMLGIAVAARRLGITTEEAIEEKKPLVN